MDSPLVLRFHSGGRPYALPLELVKEVAEIEGLTAVPRSPSGIAGLVEVRGRIVTLVDPAPPRDGVRSRRGEGPGPGRRAVVLSLPPGHLGLLVEEPLDIVPGDAEAPDGTRPELIDPAHLVERAARAIRQRYRRDAP